MSEKHQKQDEVAQYLRIAADLAKRISSGELAEQQKLSGRSLLSGEYNVSPETIRRALKRLADMKVVMVKKNSGVYVFSADNAGRYLQEVKGRQRERGASRQAEHLIDTIQKAGVQLATLVQQTIDEYEAGQPVCPQYEYHIAKGALIAGHDLAQLHFWAQTGATVVAIRRHRHLILSPGPDARLYGDDTIIFVGQPQCRQQVVDYVAGFASE